MDFIILCRGDFYLIHTIRKRSAEHNQLEYINVRGVISPDEQKKLDSLRLGFKGELQFDTLIENETPELIHVKDFRFSVDSIEYQIDNILITGDNVFLFEIKNFGFDLKYSAEMWQFMNGKDWINPIIQVDQQRNKFHQLLSLTSYILPIYSNIVFINPTQTIYNLTEHPKVHTYSNIKKRLQYIYKENKIDHSQLLQYLESQRVTDSKYSRSYSINIEQYKKGIVCSGCFGFLKRVTIKRYICANCTKTLTCKEAARELIQEIKTLNNQERLSSYKMSQLTGGQLSDAIFRTPEVKNAWDIVR